MPNFLKQVQSTPKVRAIKKKIKTAETARKKLSREYKAAIKSESRRLGKKKKKVVNKKWR